MATEVTPNNSGDSLINNENNTFKGPTDSRFVVLSKPDPCMVNGTICFEPCIAPHKKFWGAIITGLCSVTPLTNITPLSMQYQLYLNYIFHRENLSFYTHLITMPLVNLFLLATAAALKFDDSEYGQWFDLSFVLVSFLFIWYTLWGFISKIYWTGPFSLPILSGIYVGAHYYQQYCAATLHPMYCVAIFSTMQSWSHVVEDLPPRVSGTPHWTTKRDFFCHEITNCYELFDRVTRALLQAMLWGSLDELIASPRLMVLFWSVIPGYKLFKVSNIKLDGVVKMDVWYNKKFPESLKLYPRLESYVDDNGELKVKKYEPKLNACGRFMDWVTQNIFCCFCFSKDQNNMIADPALDFVGRGGGVFLRMKDSTWYQLCTCFYCDANNITDQNMEFDYINAERNLYRTVELELKGDKVYTIDDV